MVKEKSVSHSYHSIAIQLISPDAKFVFQRDEFLDGDRGEKRRESF
jgi:hypothetical protein